MPEITVFGGYVIAALALAASARNLASRALAVVAPLVAVLAVVLHGWLLWHAVGSAPPGHLGLGLSNTVSLSGWLLAILATPYAFVERYRGLVAVFIAGAGVAALFTATLDPPVAAAAGQPLWHFISHAVLATLSYSLFMGAAILAIITTLKDRRLRRAGDAGQAMLPPLESMERKMFAAIGVGFALLSLAILSGLIFVHSLLEQHLTHKFVLTLIAWFVFGILLFGRWKFGWRGRKAVRLTLAGFLILVLAYFGSRIVLEMVLGRQWG